MKKLGRRVGLAAMMFVGLVTAGCTSDAEALCESVCDCASGTGAQQACAEDTCVDQIDTFLELADDLGCEQEGDDFVTCLVDRFQCNAGVAEVDCASAQKTAEECMGVQIELGISPPSRSQ